MQKRNLVYITVALSSLLLLAGFLAGFYVHGVTTAPSTLTLSSGIYPGAPSYTVWVESSVFYVKDANGYTVVSVTNSTEAIQYAINGTWALGGGTVYVKRGVYSASVTVKSTVYLILDPGLGGGVQYEPDPIGYCTVEDRSNQNKTVYWNGVAKYSIDVSSGLSTYTCMAYKVGDATYLKSGSTGELLFYSTNASETFNYALTYTSNGVVFIKAGTYTFTAPILMRNNTGLIGEGRDSVVFVNNQPGATGYVGGLIMNQNHNTSVGLAESEWNKDYNITLAHFTVHGDRAGSHNGFPIGFANVDNVFIDDVKTLNCVSDSINFNGMSVNAGGLGQGNGTTSGLTISNCVFQDTGVDALAMNNVQNFHIVNFNSSYTGQLGATANGWGITMAGNCSYGMVQNFIIQHSSDYSASGAGGLHIIDAKYVSFTGGYIASMNGTGVKVESDAGNPQYLEFSNVQVINSTLENWKIINAYDITILGCLGLNAGYYEATTYNNLYFYNSERSRVIGMELRDNQAAHTTENGVYEDAAGGSNIFMGISIFGCSNATGIYLLGTGTLNSTIICTP